MMKKLNDKKTKWLKKLKEGNEQYIMIARDEDQWYFIAENHAEQILSMKIAVDEGYGLRREYIYDISESEIDAMSFAAIMKDERELLIEDINGLVAFGIEEVESPAEAIFIYFRTERRHTFVFGCQECCSLNMLRAMPLENCGEDTYIMDDIFSNPGESRFVMKTEEASA